MIKKFLIKKYVGQIVGAVLLLGLFGGCYLANNMPYPANLNDKKMNRFYRSVMYMSEMSEVDYIDSLKRFGVLFGNGNHCDSEVAIAFKTTKTPSEVVKVFNAEDVVEQIDYPYSRGEDEYISIFEVRNEKLFMIANSDEYGISCDSVTCTFDSSDIYMEFYLEIDDYNLLVGLGSGKSLSDGERVYILRTTDQSQDSYYSLDSRCN